MTVTKNILIVDDIHQFLIEKLRLNGFQVDYQPNISKSDVLLQIPHYEGLIVRSKLYIDKEFLSSAINLEFIGRAGAGIDNIDEKAAKEAGVVVFNAPEGNRNAVAEHAIGMLLVLFNNLIKSHQEVGRRIWDREGNRGYEIGGKTIGIFGYGNTGGALAKKLQGFDCNVIAYDKYVSEIGDSYVQQVSLEEFYDQADIVSIHIPLTAETDSFINKEFFNSFRKEIFLVNTSRGKVLLLKDLLHAIIVGKVKGACLDVLENEKLSTFTEDEENVLKELEKTEKLVFSPHIAGWTFESYLKISSVLAEKVLNFYFK